MLEIWNPCQIGIPEGTSWPNAGPIPPEVPIIPFDPAASIGLAVEAIIALLAF